MHACTVVSTIISIARWSTSIDTDIRLAIVCRFARTHRGTIRDTSIVNIAVCLCIPRTTSRCGRRHTRMRCHIYGMQIRAFVAIVWLMALLQVHRTEHAPRVALARQRTRQHAAMIRVVSPCLHFSAAMALMRLDARRALHATITVRCAVAETSAWTTACTIIAAVSAAAACRRQRKVIVVHRI